MLLYLLLLFCRAEVNRNSIEVWTDFTRLWQSAGTYLFKDMGKFTKANVITMGKSIYDKKTLINSMFGEKIANTKDENEQKTIEIYSKKDKAINVYDTPKIELDLSNVDGIFNQASELVNNLSKTNDASNYIHYLFYVISCENDYFDERERMLIHNLESDPRFKNIKIIIVLTQCAFEEQKLKMIRKIGSTKLTIVPYLAKKKIEITACCKEVVISKPYGLDDLVTEMINSLPDILYDYYEDFKSAKIKYKRILAAIAVGSGTLVSTLSTFIPNPLAKYSVLGLSEISMLYAIKSIYEIDYDDIKKNIKYLGGTAFFSGVKFGYKLLKGGKSTNTNSTCEKGLDEKINVEHFSEECSEFINEYNLFSALNVGITTLVVGSAASVYADYLYKQKFVSKEQFTDYVASISNP